MVKQQRLTGGGNRVETLKTEETSSGAGNDAVEAERQETARTGLVSHARLDLFRLDVPVMKVH